MLSFEDACFQWASGFYLTEHVDDDWFELDEEDQDEFLESHLWQPFEFYDARMISKEIASLAHWIQEGQYPVKKDFVSIS